MYIAPKPTGESELPENRFEFQVTEDGPVYSVPKLKFIKPELVVAMSGPKAKTAVFSLLTEYAPDALAEMKDNGQLTGVYLAWVEASTIDVGESSGSGISSPSIAEPSTVTSSSSADLSTISEPTA